jgi:hypothetical protein
MLRSSKAQQEYKTGGFMTNLKPFTIFTGNFFKNTVWQAKHRVLHHKCVMATFCSLQLLLPQVFFSNQHTILHSHK